MVLDDDGFVTESSDEAVSDEPVFLFCFVLFFVKKVWKAFVYQIIPFSAWPPFVAMTMSRLIMQKQTLECILSTLSLIHI